MPTKWRTVRVFISSTFRDMHAERDYLVRVVFPALREKLLPYRLHLNDIDLRWGVTKEQAENDQTLDLCLQQIDECRPFFVGILGERYGWVSAKLPNLNKPEYGWIQGLTGKSITELEILHGVLNNPKMHPHSIFLFRDPAFMADVPEGARFQVAAEDDEAAKRLANLKQRIRRTNLPIPPLEKYPCRFAGLRLNWQLVRLDLEESDANALEAVAVDGLVTNEEYAALAARLREIVNREAVVYLDGLEEFGKAVYSRLWEAIKDEYDLPEKVAMAGDGERDELAEELDYHERFMESHLRIYLGREHVQQKLHGFANSDQKIPCLVTGASGSGKSAAMAKFISDYARDHPSVLVIPHFVGASPDSTNLRLALRRFCRILQREFAFTETRKREGQPTETVPAEVPQTITELVPTFRKFVSQVPRGRCVLLAIDALDQLDEADNAQTMYWLQREWPAHVKAVLSCVDDPKRSERVLQAFERRAHHRLEIGALTGGERLEIIRRVPSLSAKTLDSTQISFLLKNPATENPLFLLVALEELRSFGSFEQVASRIRSFPRGSDAVTVIFTQVIERLENEFGEELTRTVLSLLAAARRGLSDHELLELIEGKDTKIEESATSLFPILRQLRPYLQHRGELLDFLHRDLYRAVQNRYLLTDKSQAAAHGRLADYFASQNYFTEGLEEQRARTILRPPTPLRVNIRKVDELPYQRLQLAILLGEDDPHSEHWAAVVNLLTEWAFLEAQSQSRLMFALLGEYAEVLRWIPNAHPWRRILELIEKALCRDVYFINGNPTTLLQSLWNSCWWYDCPEAAAHYTSGATPKRSHSSPRNSCPTLHELCESWRVQAEQACPGFVWLRSLRPPSIPLGSDLAILLRGHEFSVDCVTWSPDGRWIASGSGDTTIRLWDARTGEERAVLRGHRHTVSSITFSPDGRRLASASIDKTIRVWEVDTGEEEAVLRGHTHSVSTVSFSPDGSKLASGSFDKTVRIWDVRNGREVAILHGHENIIQHLAFCLDGRRLASGSQDEGVRVWDIYNGVQLATYCDPSRQLMGLMFSREGQLIVSDRPSKQEMLRTRDQSVRLRNIEAEHSSVLVNITGMVHCVTFSPDGRQIAIGCNEGIRFLGLEGGVKHSNIPCRVRCMAFSPDGKRIAAGIPPGTDVQVWETKSNTVSNKGSLSLERIWGLRAGHARIAFAPDGRRIAVASHCRVHLWDSETGLRLQVLGQYPVLNLKTVGATGPTARAMTYDFADCICFSPDGLWLAWGESNGMVVVWDIENGKKIATLEGHESGVLSVAFSPDGRRLASGAKDKTVRVWEVGTKKQMRVLCGDKWEVTGVLFSPDGRYLAATSNRTVRICDLKTGTELAVLLHTSMIAVTAYSRDGRRIITIAGDRVLRIWDVLNGNCLEETEFRGTSEDVTLSPYGLIHPWGLKSEVIRVGVLGNPRAIGFYPARCDGAAASPSGRTLAVFSGSEDHLYILRLEGDIQELQADDDSPKCPDQADRSTRNATCAGLWLVVVGLILIFYLISWLL